MDNQQQTFNINEAIIDVMSINPDILMTIHNVHSRLYEKYKIEMSTSLKRDDIIRELKKAFREINNNYENINRVFRENVEYLIWSPKSHDDILQCLDLFQTYEDYLRKGKNPDTVEYRTVFPTIEADLQLPKEKSILEKIIDMVNAHDPMIVSDSKTVDGNLTIIHYLIQENKLELLRKIYIDYNPTFSTNTIKTNQSCIQLAMKTNDCNMVEFVMTVCNIQKVDCLYKKIDSLKNAQSSLYDDIRSLKNNNQLLQTAYDSSRIRRLINKINSYIVFFMILYFCFFNK